MYDDNYNYIKNAYKKTGRKKNFGDGVILMYMCCSHVFIAMIQNQS